MKQLYAFENKTPPVINENMLKAKIEKKKIQRQTALLAAGGILLQIAVILLGLLAFNAHPWVTLFCIIYVLLSATGSSVLAVVFAKKEVL